MSSDLLCSEVERLLLDSPVERFPNRHGKSDVQFNLFVEPPPATSSPVMSATITDLCSEPLFSSSYLSEEEESSASDTDDRSFSTGTTNSLHGDESNDTFEATLPERLAKECTVVQEPCKHAQAIRVVAAGRPKVVQVTKLDSSHRRPSLSAPRRPSLSPALTRAPTQPHRRPSTMLESIVIAASEHPTPSLSRRSSSGSRPPSLDDGFSTTSSSASSNPITPNPVLKFDPCLHLARRHKSVAAVGHHDRTHDEYRPRPLHVTKHSGSHAPPIMTAPPTYSYIPPSYANKANLVARAADRRLTISFSPPPHSQEAEIGAFRSTSRPSVARGDSNFFGRYRNTMRTLPVSNKVDSKASFHWI